MPSAFGIVDLAEQHFELPQSTSLAYFVTVPQNDYKNVAYMSFLERSKCIICLCLNQPSTIGYINPVRPTTCQRCKRSVTQHKNVEYSSSLYALKPCWQHTNWTKLNSSPEQWGCPHWSSISALFHPSVSKLTPTLWADFWWHLGTAKQRINFFALTRIAYYVYL